MLYKIHNAHFVFKLILLNDLKYICQHIFNLTSSLTHSSKLPLHHNLTVETNPCDCFSEFRYSGSMSAVPSCSFCTSDLSFGSVSDEDSMKFCHRNEIYRNVWYRGINHTNVLYTMWKSVYEKETEDGACR